MGKKKKSHKKEHKKKHHRSRSKSPKGPRSDSSRSNSRHSTASDMSSADSKPKPVLKSAKEVFNDYLGTKTDMDWHLKQKSESLLFEATKEPEKNETFIWRKKNQKTGLDKLEPEKILMLNKLKQEETARELEKLKRRKIEREREREEREREREFEQRQKEAEYHQEWEKQEDSFHLKQVKLRSKIRIEEGRAKPIDLLAKYISAEEDHLAIEMHEPYMYLNGLTIKDLDDLLADIEVYSDLEKGVNAEFWRDIQIVTEDELKKLQKMDKNSREHAGDRREGINASVMQDVAALFRGKSYEELIKLEESINKKIREETGIDIGYWESLLSQLKAHMARARLRERHKKVLYEKLKTLKQQQGLIQAKKAESAKARQEEKNEKEQEIGDGAATESKGYRNQDEYRLDDDDDDDDSDSGRQQEQTALDKLEADEDHAEADETDQTAALIAEYQNGGYSPTLLRADDLPFDTFIITQEEDVKRIEFQRKQVLGTGYVKADLEEEFEKKARDTMGGIIPSTVGGEDDPDDPDKMDNLSHDDGDQSKQKSNTIEMPIEHHYLWSDKYRPRKPRYYNRVHTGYDWNQYNKKHYDVDNPPPKTVQGYKFNIFYPDLIDKAKTPSYSITPCPENKDFATLRFHAGAPYEDVAFKIVNKEWDISHRHGFRNQFQNGIYQLWFHFRRWKYRR